ncbi:unnamed protein product [Porites evermanni]|uniref:Uncharacterized protein n=1 Tax=Porites evermanni TaxID=104178 RepID=A0ABN8M9T8_9CNID|nr:unnamed protein product [Porites evermanni]
MFSFWLTIKIPLFGSPNFRSGMLKQLPVGCLAFYFVRSFGSLPLILELITQLLIIFKAWCLQSTGEVSFLPATSFTVSLYLYHLLENSLGSSIIYGVFYAINWVHKLSGFENPNLCDNFLVRSIVEASSRAPRNPPLTARSEGATSAANLNVPDRLFKVHGRWKSDSAKDGYVHDKVDSRLYVPLHIGI